MFLKGRWQEGLNPNPGDVEAPPVLVMLLNRPELAEVLQTVAKVKVSRTRYRDEDDADEDEALRKWVRQLCIEFKIEGFREYFARDAQCVSLLLKALGVDAKPSETSISDPEHATINVMRRFLESCSGGTALKQILEEGVLDRMLLRVGELQAEKPRRLERVRRFQLVPLSNIDDSSDATVIPEPAQSLSASSKKDHSTSATTSTPDSNSSVTNATSSASVAVAAVSSANSKVMWRPGYGTGETPATMNWLEAERLAQKQEKQKRAAVVFECLTIYLNRADSESTDWKAILDCFDASCFLRVTMASFFEVTAKAVVENSQFYIRLLELVAALASRSELTPIFGEVPGMFRSLKQLMQSLRKMAKDDLDDEEDEVSKKLMAMILATCAKTDACVEATVKSTVKSGTEASVASTRTEASENEFEIYEKAMRGELFKDVDMRDPDTQQYSRHHFQTAIQEDAKDSAASKSRFRRINRELKALKTTLPLHFGSTIALRIDRTRPFVGQCIIFAPQNTPYDTGAFLFDFFCASGYPNEPPRVNLQTTGQGRVRFNPNLYQTGKVCLSLLGTWRGGASGLENWSSETSSLYQVFVSIQSAILGSEFPYFNEPSVEVQFGTDEGELNKRIHPNGGYERLRVATIQHAMTAQIQTPPPGFEQAIRTHFRLKCRYIREVYAKWLIEAELSNTPGHLQSLKEAIGDLEKAFSTLGDGLTQSIAKAPQSSETGEEEEKTVCKTSAEAVGESAALAQGSTEKLEADVRIVKEVVGGLYGDDNIRQMLMEHGKKSADGSYESCNLDLLLDKLHKF